MRPIKFRGKDIKIDKYVYFGGCLQIHTGTTYIVGGTGGGSRKFYRVKPDSVAQLVGYDADGEEVYEGDKLIDIFGEEYTAAIYDLPQVTQTSKLKEVQA